MATAAVVIALSGGMVGKIVCGFLAARIGDRNAYTVVQLATLLALPGLIYLPVEFIFVLLPAVGLVMQGSSTVSYGAVAGFVEGGKQARGYALIYTLATGGSVVGPFVFGVIADHTSLDTAMLFLIVTVALSIPTGMVLNRKGMMQK